MKTIKVWGTYFYALGAPEEKLKIWQVRGFAPPDMEIVFTEETPDYIIASDDMYYNQSAMETVIRHKKRGAVLIFYPYEMLYPDFNLFDYAVTFASKLNDGDRHIRTPVFVYNFMELPGYSLSSDLPLTLSLPHPTSHYEDILRKKTAFCNFIYRNGDAHPNRDRLFHKICEYKLVDSLGEHLRNKTEENNDRNDEDNWARVSVEIKSRYKFTIAVENAWFEGYTSEKIITTFQADSIPIYWGNPLIHEDFNPKAFINCHDYSNFDEVLATVKKIDQNDDLWLEMISQPRCLPWQIEKHREEEENLRRFFTHIFEQDIEQARRAPQGWRVQHYQYWVENSLYRPQGPQGLKKMIANRIIRKIRNMAVCLGLKKPLK